MNLNVPPITGCAAGTSAVACPGLPRGLALIGNGPHRVWRVTRAGMTSLADVGTGVVITKAVRGRDGTIWVEARHAVDPTDRGDGSCGSMSTVAAR